MAGTSSVNLNGTLKITTTRRAGEITLLEIISGIEGKTIEVNIPANASNQVIPLGFPPTVDHAVFLHLYSPKKLIVEYTGKDAVSGPIKLGLKGHHLLTMQPGEGIIQIRVSNPSATEAVTIEVSVGCLEDPSDTVDFFES